jgi:hypothetical protein
MHLGDLEIAVIFDGEKPDATIRYLGFRQHGGDQTAACSKAPSVSITRAGLPSSLS